MSAIKFGAYLQQLRKQRKATLEDVSRWSGISAAQISRIETNNRNTPKPLTIRKLAEALQFPYEKLLEVAGYIEPPVRNDLKEVITGLIAFHSKELKRLEKELLKITSKEVTT